jgi:hypothetical protein
MGAPEPARFRRIGREHDGNMDCDVHFFPISRFRRKKSVKTDPQRSASTPPSTSAR